MKQRANPRPHLKNIDLVKGDLPGVNSYRPPKNTPNDVLFLGPNFLHPWGVEVQTFLLGIIGTSNEGTQGDQPPHDGTPKVVDLKGCGF